MNLRSTTDTEKMDDLWTILKKGMNRPLGVLAYMIEAEAKEAQGKGPSGRKYRIGKGNTYHTASAAPGPPAVDTGLLKGSINAQEHGDVWRVHDGVSYGIHLEFGTYKMGARPWMGPAAARAWNKAAGIAQEYLMKAKEGRQLPQPSSSATQL